MAIVKNICLTFLMSGFIALHAQEPTPHPCKGSTVDTYDATVAASSRAFVVELQKFVHAGDKKAIAGHVGYPLRVNTTVDGKRSYTTIRNKQQFVAAYDRLFNDKVKAAILNPDSVRCLFANDQGFMIGNGQVWFEQTAGKTFQISALNP